MEQSNYRTYTEELESYNEAVRYANAEHQRLASIRGMTKHLKAAFEKIQKDTEADIAWFNDFLDGKNTLTSGGYHNYSYIEWPDKFRCDINDLRYLPGDLGAEEWSWIAETKERLKKYYCLYLENKKKQYPDIAENIEKNTITYMETAWPELAELLKSQKKTDLKNSRSKVCRIANRIERSVSRKEAFTMAWQIVKNGGLEIKVAGVSFYNRQEALRRLTAYEPRNIHAFLVPEYENEYDANAIAVQVMVQGGKGVYRIGYVPKTETAIVKAFIGTVPELKVLDGDIRGAKVRLAA